MKNQKKKDVYAMIYKRQLISDDLIIFLPCSCSFGVFDPSDNSFIDNIGNPYYECDNYDIVTSSIDLTYYYDITPKDLKNMYNVSDEKEALEKFSDNLRGSLLIGIIDNYNEKIDLCSISYETIVALSKEILYSTDDNDETVTLTSMQLEDMLQFTDIKKLKDKLSEFLKRTKALKQLKEEKGVEQVVTNATGTKVTYFDVKQKSDNQAKEPQVGTASSQISAKEVYDFVTSSLVGQDDAVEDMISSIINNMNATNPSEIIKPLLIGPTGSGKSLLFDLLEKILDIPVISIDCNLLVQSGYEGQTIDDVLKNLYHMCNKDISKINRAIVFFDEIDKLAAKGAGVSDIGVQQALLKFIEGSKYVVEIDKFSEQRVVIDTSMMSIVAGGAFETLFEKKKKTIGFDNTKVNSNPKITPKDIIDFGMISELIGRFNLIVQYNEITEEMIYEQLNRSMLSPIRIKKQFFLKNYNATLTFEESYLEKLCALALQEKSGFRGIKRTINNSLKKVEFELQCEPLGSKIIIISKETLDDPKCYRLIKK